MAAWGPIRRARVRRTVVSVARPSLSVSCVVRGDAVWLCVEGDLSIDGVAALNSAFRDAEREQPDMVGLEISQVPFIDSSVLHAFASAARRARRRGGRFVLAHPSDPVRRVFALTAFDQALEVIDPVASTE